MTRDSTQRSSSHARLVAKLETRLPAAIPFILALATAFFAAPLGAQQPDTTAADTLPFALRPLEVEVLRQPVALRSAPFALSVLAGEQLRRARASTSLRESLVAVPGVQVDDRHNEALGERISIRGFGARAQFGVRGVRAVVDGIPATFADGQTALSHVDPALLGRVEVLRGPAAALWGNAAGGVLLMEMREPPRAPLAGEARLGAGADGLLRGEALAGGRSGGTGWLAAVSRREADGFREWSSFEKTHFAGRLGHASGDHDLQLTASAVTYDARNPGSLSSEQLAESRVQAHGFNVTQRTGETGSQVQGGARWRRHLGEGQAELALYGIGRSIDNPIPPVIIDLDRKAAGARALYRSAREGGLHDVVWSVGLETAGQWDDRRNFANEAGDRGERELDQSERVWSGAAFGQVGLAATERLSLLGGLRFDRFGFRVEDRLVAGDPDDSGERAMSALSPSVGASWDFGRSLLVYGNVATAFETPTTTELANRPDGAGGFNPQLEPQRTLSFELGGRGDFGPSIGWEAAFYRARVEDALIPFEVTAVPGRQFFRNAGSALHRGAELGLSAAPLPRVLVRVAYAWTDARFEDYTTADASFDGNRVPGIAPHALEGVLTWAGDGWLLAAEHRWADAMPVDDANATESPAYHVTDVRAGLRALRVGGASAEPFVGVTNLFDSEYNASVVVNAFGGRYFEPGPGRALYLGLELAVGP